MRKVLLLCAACLAVSWSANADSDHQVASAATQSYAIGQTSVAEALEAAFQQIELYEQNQWEVTKEMYDFYFKLDRLVNPEIYAEMDGRTDESGALDQLIGTCPGSIILGPQDEEEMVIRTCGSTSSGANHCSYPDCRLGRDVVAQLVVDEDVELTITTTGSSFDTYLCVYDEDGCCGEEGSNLIAFNNNNPSLCNGQRLAAGLYFPCINAGTYYVILDGAFPSAHGSYCLTFDFSDNCND